MLAVAETGHYRAFTGWKCLEVSSNVKMGYGAKDLARKIGLLRPLIGGDRLLKDENKGLGFAESIDKILT